MLEDAGAVGDFGEPSTPLDPSLVQLPRQPLTGGAVDAPDFEASAHAPTETGRGIGLPIAPHERAIYREGRASAMDESKYARMSTGELRWNLNRERGEQSNMGWMLHVCLCGPVPGPALPPMEYPGKRKKKKREHKGRRAFAKPEAVPEYAHVEESAAAANYRQNVFDALAGSDGALSRDKAAACARHLGYAPTEADIAKLPDSTTNEVFSKWIYEIQHPEDQNQDAMMLPFKIFDKDNSGYISTFAFETILLAFGEPLSPEQTKEILALAAPQGGRVQYQKFLANLLDANRHLPPTSQLSKEGVDLSKLASRGESQTNFF